MDFNNKVAIVTSEKIYISGGMTRQMICHGDNGWRLSPMERWRLFTMLGSVASCAGTHKTKIFVLLQLF